MKTQEDIDEIRRYMDDDRRGCTWFTLVLLLFGAFAGMGLAWLIVSSFFTLCL